MQTFGDLMLVASILIALIFVPPYLWKQYGGPPVVPWIVNCVVGFLDFIMASRQNYAPQNADMDAVYVPVSHTSMPQLVYPETEEELLTLLADFRRPDNKFRFSANQIYTLIGGDRNTVMRQIKELREGKSEAQYPPLSPQQATNREALGLPPR